MKALEDIQKLLKEANEGVLFSGALNLFTENKHYMSLICMVSAHSAVETAREEDGLKYERELESER